MRSAQIFILNHGSQSACHGLEADRRNKDIRLTGDGETAYGRRVVYAEDSPAGAESRWSREWNPADRVSTGSAGMERRTRRTWKKA